MNVGLKIKVYNDFADIMELLQKAADKDKIGSIDKLLQKSAQTCLKWMRHQIQTVGYDQAFSVKYEKVMQT
jgi:hypothetical protein